MCLCYRRWVHAFQGKLCYALLACERCVCARSVFLLGFYFYVVLSPCRSCAWYTKQETLNVKPKMCWFYIFGIRCRIRIFSVMKSEIFEPSMTESTDAYCTCLRTDARLSCQPTACHAIVIFPLSFSHTSHGHQLFFGKFTLHWEVVVFCGWVEKYLLHDTNSFPKKSSTDVLLIEFDKVLLWMVPILANYFELTHSLCTLNSNLSQYHSTVVRTCFSSFLLYSLNLLLHAIN